MKYFKVGPKPGFIESLATFLCSVVFLFTLAIPAHVLGIAWATIRWHFTRGMFLYADLDSTRAEADKESTEIL